MAALAGSAVVTACSGMNDNRRAPPAGDTPDGAAGDSGSCKGGDEEECHVMIGEHEGVLTCVDGTRQCAGGTWGACNGVTRTRSAPSGAQEEPLQGGHAMPMSLSDPAPCAGNPCDPRCQTFNEDPGGGGVTIPSGAPPFAWGVGDINQLPASVLDQGTQEPCTTAEDCQFDQFCNNPARGACSHDACATGPGLFSTCNPCVQKVCDADPSCCQPVYAGSCLHDPCVSGSALKKGCDPCVTSICATRPGCCEPLCVTDADCVPLVGPASTCNAQGRCSCGGAVGACPAGASCSAGRCVPFWGSGSCVALVDDPLPTGCAKTCPTPSVWTSSCVGKVSSICGAFCDPSSPTKGQCIPWPPDPTPGQPDHDPSCAGVDLTAPVPCGGTVPVCNRGSSPVPAGSTIDIVSYPAGAGEMPSSAPGEVLTSCSPSPGTAACSMTLAADLGPGECINVTGCAGLSDGMELMVNPAGANHINECHCENNWSIHQSAACTSPGCIAKASVSLVRKVTLFLAVDRSTSMRCSGTAGCSCSNDRLTTRWNPVKNALISFIQDPGSAGLGVALRFWPDNGCDGSTCPPGGGACAAPEVPLGTLTAASGAADPQETALVNAIASKTACGNTPMYPALDGAESWAIQHKSANPDEEVVVVFLTDGLPTDCNTNNNAIAGLAATAFQGYGVRTYAIGVSTQSNPTQIDQIASAGGGASFFMNDGAALQQGLLQAMLSIRGDALPCDISIPLEGVSDPANVQMTWTSGMGIETELPYLTDPAGCVSGGGWYVDPVNPELARLCPDTCGAVQAEEGGKVQAVYGDCSTDLAPATYAQTYEAQCPPGTKVQWGYLTYESTTPGDSSVELEVRTAEALADLSSAAGVTVAIARAAPADTQVCDVGGPAGCPIDLFTELGGLPDARNEALELTMTLNPTSDLTQAPTVHAWEITYSCPDSE